MATSAPRGSSSVGSAKRKALVLGHGTRAFLSVVRSLGRAGIEVHVGWFEEGEPALRSRYVAEAHRIPEYRPDGLEWKDVLAVLMRRERFDLVIPCDDQRALPLAEHRDDLERCGRVWLPSPEALTVLGDKFKTAELARSLGVPVPRQAIVSERSQLPPLRNEFSPPLILKPPISYTVTDIAERRLVRRADSWRAADLLLEEMLAKGPVAVQEFCRGSGVGVELLLSSGTPLLAFQHLRLHEPLNGGGSSYRRGVPVDPELFDASVKLLGALDYTGVAMVEFKCDAATGRCVLLEVNARFWGSLPLALASGVDFPLALFRLVVEGRTDGIDSYRVGLSARNLRADARWHVTNLRADRSDPTLNTRAWRGVVLETCSSVLTGRERTDTFTLDDPVPGMAELAQVGRSSGRRLAARVRAPVSRRRRRRMEVAARADLARAARVLFVCKGNIGRSPFAAALAREVLGDQHEFLSAGLLRSGRRPPADAVAAAAVWDVDLTAHRSRVLSAELVRSSDAIFVFDRTNHSETSVRFPEARSRLHFLGALDARGALHVPDPWGRGPGAYAAAYRRIADALSAAVKR